MDQIAGRHRPDPEVISAESDISGVVSRWACGQQPYDGLLSEKQLSYPTKLKFCYLGQ